MIAQVNLERLKIQDYLPRPKKKHYWLTPPEFLESLEREFGVLYDPCPYPRPEGFDGLKEDWRSPAYCNPPFQNGIMLPFVRKAILEAQKGKTVSVIFPVHCLVHELVRAGAELRALGRFPFLAIEDKSIQSGPALCILAVLRDPRKNCENCTLVWQKRTLWPCNECARNPSAHQRDYWAKDRGRK